MIWHILLMRIEATAAGVAQLAASPAPETVQFSSKRPYTLIEEPEELVDAPQVAM